MLTVTKIFQFSAAHFLPNYEGPCQNLHGHTWKMEVTVKGDLIPSGPKAGMVVDFKDLKAFVEDTIIKQYDHKLLNDIYENPTAENMVKEIFRVLVRSSKDTGYRFVRLRLWESDTAYAEYDGNLY